MSYVCLWIFVFVFASVLCLSLYFFFGFAHVFCLSLYFHLSFCLWLMFVVVFLSLFLPMSYVCLCIFVFVFAHGLCLSLYFRRCFYPCLMFVFVFSSLFLLMSYVLRCIFVFVFVHMSYICLCTFVVAFAHVLCLSLYFCFCFCPCHTFVFVFASSFLPVCLMFVFATCGRPRWPLGGCGCVRSEDTLLGRGHALPAGKYFVLFGNFYSLIHFFRPALPACQFSKLICICIFICTYFTFWLELGESFLYFQKW